MASHFPNFEPGSGQRSGATSSVTDAMSRPRILHLRASNFVGGPEHQLLRSTELEAGGPFEISIATFEGGGEGSQLRQAAEARGIATIAYPVGSRAALKALEQTLRDRQIDVLCTHGYKADILGILAGRRCGVRVACFLRGWTCLLYTSRCV